tara:strand:- start:46372 stop:47562 length:1191 start_codon:yes stop_codon:yes gene_type:complete
MEVEKNIKVALIAAPYVAVPPKLYGGAERRINTLCTYLKREGVNVTLFASGDSTPEVPLKPIYDFALSENPRYDHKTQHAKYLAQVNLRTLSHLDEDDYDLVNVHDYENLGLIKTLADRDTPVLVSIRHILKPSIQKVFETFKDHPNIHFHGVSYKQIEELDPNMPFIHDTDDSSFYEAAKISEKRDYFFSIGCMKNIKGHRLAIDLTKRIGMDIIISGGSLSSSETKRYFEEEIKPKVDVEVGQRRKEFLEGIVTGTHEFGKGRVINFGPSDDQEKKILFKYAQFMQSLGNLETEGNIDACPGTIIESTLSGTPILGVRGSISEELTREGLTGINISSLDEAKIRASELSHLDPNKVRSFAVKDFSPIVMARKYIDLYSKALRDQSKFNSSMVIV